MRTVQGCGLLMLLVAGLGMQGVGAQGYPNKPVRIHAATPGGGSDTVARALAEHMSLGQSVLVENVSGSILVAGVAKAAPDGYTLLVTGSTLWIAPLFSEMPYDPVRDFAPIVNTTRAPNILIVTSSLPVKTVADLIRYAKAKPGELSHATGADGSGTHVVSELFQALGGIKSQRIFYKDSAEITDTMSGRVQMAFGSGASWGAAITSGKVRALATSGATRSAMFPDLPTIGETLPGFSFDQLLGFLAPGKTPDAIVRRLNQEANRALQKPEMRDRLLKAGLETVGGTPEQFGAIIKSEIANVTKVIKAAGVKPGA